jgi:hypothetical protein
MNWEGPGVLFRTKSADELIQLSMDIHPIMLKFIAQDRNDFGDDGDLLEKDFRSSDIDFHQFSLQEIQNDILNHTFLQGIFKQDAIAIVFLVWDKSLPMDVIQHGVELLIDYAEKYQNMIVVCTLSVEELKLLQMLENLSSPNLFITYGFIRREGSLCHPAPYLYQILRKEIQSGFLNYSIANKVLVEDASAELSSFKDYLLCIQQNRNPILDMKQKGVRLFGVFMSDKKTTFSERLIILGIKNFLMQRARKYLYEPNNHELWKRVERDITFILKEIWNAGVLKGNTPEEAFYVICDERNNHLTDEEVSYLNISVGVALAKPAQFFEIELQNIVEVMPA